ncbi:MAG: redoxin domain-containing protein [Verrucomicrobia bacterium]|nr:redoxin domain-containing protein [Verrucomicrobiota bacterium]
MSEYKGSVSAPEFPAGVDWLNADRSDSDSAPLTLEALRGKVVLLDFWTYCCINCMHVIPDLKRLEAKYADELVVIGVHSAKFTAESETENIRQAILRYEIEHPVINDRNMVLWRAYGIRAWPSFVLIDPAGKLVGYASGEGVYDTFDAAIANVIAAFDKQGLIDRTPLDLALERARAPRAVLSFPGKVLADDKTDQLFIADSNHNRIVVLSLDDNSVKAVIGSGTIGLTDGRFEEASFNHPQGMALGGPSDGRVLYVADTENHAIRAVDLESRTVRTIAGTGAQARRVNMAGPGSTTALNSPWDLVLHDGDLYIAMAGSHQIWRMDLTSGRVEPYAGSGREDRTDGPLRSAALAQPSGLTTDGAKLYFADSEVSAIRSADLGGSGRVETIVGGELFKFGDVDGKGLTVRLQHPLGVVYHDGALYVADTYNNKIKRVTLNDRRAETFVGTGKEGRDDGENATFNEPGGITVAGDKLYIADTNNSLIRVADLATRHVETLEIKDADALWPKPEMPGAEEQAIELAAQTVRPGDTKLVLTLALPEHHKLTAGAPTQVVLRSADGTLLSFDGESELTLDQPAFPVTVPVRASAGKTMLTIEYAIYFCKEGLESLCSFDSAKLALPVEVDTAGTGEALSLTISPKTQ